MEKAKNVALKIAALFYKDLLWKLLALGLAMILWFVGININNPVQSTRYERMLRIQGRNYLQMNDVVLLNAQELEQTLINITISATRSDHMLLAGRSENVIASINLSDINYSMVRESAYPVNFSLDVDVSTMPPQEDIRVRPQFVTLTLDRYGERTMDIQIDITGIPLEGYVMRRHWTERSIIRITGAQSALDRVDSVRLEVDIQNAYETVARIERIVIYDSNQNNITETVNLGTIESLVTVEILPFIEIPLVVEPSGVPAQGFVHTGTRIYPRSVQLVGTQEELDEMRVSGLSLGALELDTVNDNIDFIFDIRVALEGTGLTLLDGEPTEAEVVGYIEERIITRDFEMPLERISVSGTTYAFSFANNNPVRFSVRGRESVVNRMGLHSISARLDLSGLEPGIHMVPVHLTSPMGTDIPGRPTVAITVRPPAIEDGMVANGDSDTTDIDDIENNTEVDDIPYINNGEDNINGEDDISNGNDINGIYEMDELNGINGTNEITTNNNSDIYNDYDTDDNIDENVEESIEYNPLSS